MTTATKPKQTLVNIFNSLKGSGIEKHKQFLEEIALHLPEEYITVEGKIEDGTPNERERHEFIRIYQGDVIPLLREANDYKFVEDVTLSLEKDGSVIAEYVFEYHPSCYSIKKFKYFIY